jgi:predicted secreted Zn-dependent protease
MALIRLPRWVDRESASSRAKRQWECVYGVLERHEREHARINAEEAVEAGKVLHATPAQASCKELSAELERRFQAAHAKAFRGQRAFDRETKHGTSESQACF